MANRTRTLGLLLAFSIATLAQRPPAARPSGAGQTTAAKPALEKKSALDKAVLEEYLRHLNLWPSQVTVSIGDAQPSPTLPGFFDVKVKASLGARSIESTYLVSKDGQKVLQANVYDISTSPFQEDRSKLKIEDVPMLGTPAAPVKMVVFSDFQCGFCRQEAKMLRENLVQAYPQEIALYYKDFPLEAIHPWARAAAIAGRCIYKIEPGSFWDFHDHMFDKQDEITPENLKGKVMEWAASHNVDAIRFNQCMETKAVEGDLEASISDAKAMMVSSTPTLFINGRRLQGSTDWPTLKNIIDHELAYEKKRAAECCTLDLPKSPSSSNSAKSPEGK